MATSNVEKRLQSLEAEVAELKRQLQAPGNSGSSWLDKWWGAFANDPAHEEATRLGREWRDRENAKSLKKRPKKPRMYVLDTDYLSLIGRADSKLGQHIKRRMETIGLSEFVTTIANYEEQTRGWLAFAASAKTVAKLIDAYRRLATHLSLYREIRVLDFDESAATRFQALKGTKLGVGTMDLRIAAIVLTHDATLLSRNLRDFERVPALKAEDWTVEIAE